MLRTGVDIIEISRIRRALTRHGARFAQRVFTAGELAVCQDRVESLAARFAGKEAVAKALGTGMWRQAIIWTDIEILRDHVSGAPQLLLHGAAAAHAQRTGLHEWSISLSHDHERAIAFVIALGQSVRAGL